MSRPPDVVLDGAQENVQETVIDLLDGHISQASGAQRQRVLSEVTKLFMRTGAGSSSAALFDDLFMRLIAGMTPDAIVPLAVVLAPLPNAPPLTLRALASHAAAAVAVPVLTSSDILTGEELAEIAATADTERLCALAGRARIDRPLSAIIVARGEQPAIERLLLNPGAAFTVDDFRSALQQAVADARGRVEMCQPVDILDFAGRRSGRCMIRDISPGGVKIELAGGGRPPDSFMLEMPGIGRTRLTCRYVWHRDSTVGAVFTEPLFDQLNHPVR